MTWSVVKVKGYKRKSGKRVRGYKQTRHARFRDVPYPKVTRISQGMGFAEHYPGCGHEVD